MKLIFSLYFFLVFSIVCACSENTNSVDVENDPYIQWDGNTAAVFNGTTPTNESALLKIDEVPGSEVQLDGETYSSFAIGLVQTNSDDVTALNSDVGTATATVDEQNTITVTSFTNNGIIGALTGISELDLFFNGTTSLEEPLRINMEEMATGEIRESVITAQVSGMDVPITLSYGPVEENVTLLTDMGPIIGCRKYQVSGQFEAAGLPLAGTLIEGSGYYHSKLGLVGYDVPDLGIGFSMYESANYGSAAEGFNVIQKVQVLDETNSQFFLSTYDRADQNDADKNTHAKMLLELRWADPELAQSGEQPDPWLVPVTFGTFGGTYYFPHELVESPASIFFPEENGNGFKYWYAFVDQADKYQPQNGISYDIIVEKDSLVPNLRVTARIGYNILPEYSY